MQEIYKVRTYPMALKENMVTGKKYRITLLTEALIRLEYCEDGVFEDNATQMAFYRDFPQTEYRVLHTEAGIEIHTNRIHLTYNEKEFSRHGLFIQVKGNISSYHSIWHYGEEIHDLKGTARTLDLMDGETPLEHGIISKLGYSVIDDSRSQILLEEGWIQPRKKGVKDMYFFGYGHDYKEALNDFYNLCGKTPMLPRFALGNWWSRYYKYTEESYIELMEHFDRENLPFTVAVIDMDWHLVDIDPKYGSGWTGYTWNREYFPDPKGFLKKLHDRGMRTTLNVHPADGVLAHEEMYEQIAKALGVDYNHKDPVSFDAASADFLEAYFKYLHHPREEEGVDFWWIDWQQGSNSKMEGVDPLWILNHYHFLDNRRGGKRPMTFSRYAGPGSHRYPVGFSGDTITTWESLDFQPYFTSTASNIGYGWWSHDIGGHMMGYKNDEMEARWVQYGIYSPIMRLHSSSSEFNGKEPWRFKKEAEMSMGEALRERHRMMPYLYTMNYRSYRENMPVVLPMYYQYPEEQQAYEVHNQYFFGSELIVAPVTVPRKTGLNVAKVTVWLPEDLWYDIHTGMMYEGGRMIDMYRDLSSIPVLAKAGSILPFTDAIIGLQAVKNPDSLRIKVFAGAYGSFLLYEDDNETCAYETGSCAFIRMEYSEQENAVFTIFPVEGDASLIPEKRSYVIELVGWQAMKEAVCATADGTEIRVKTEYNSKKQTLHVQIPETDVKEMIQVRLSTEYISRENQVIERCFDFLNQAEIEFVLKDTLYSLLQREKRIPVLMAEMNAMELEKDLYGAVMEIVTGRNK